ncbi:MAG: bifunctional diaminohydroxyphosphoribosylaminopyrimidine deaminase/5-amino-6-(5-phosphoribosylamino)uracil reductase RibD [Firmicutes bacterium]|nr:bifunctional diaminohydroxyphosphoribosylaminopyrimidine deaminase/5-amino-6-(5-phosphoribosylamino)uracil reductase RibD [Bacillota bacterium]
MSAENRTQDEKWMRRALELAAGGRGHVSPNPMVGAVIVRDGQVIGEGYHEKYGQLHAERNALADCRDRGNTPEGATIYVTLEPCCHYGKTPPCTEAIMENRLGRVVYGTTDPNPLVAGKGLQILRDAGITVDGPVLEEECRDLNRIFFHYMTTGLPYVILKYAMTADGKIATVTGDSKWITGEEARRHVHQTRKAVAAIMAGIGTVLADDPMLNCRVEEGVDPVRIICDSKLRIPAESQIVKTAGDIRTIVACAGDGSPEMQGRAKELRKKGLEILTVEADAEGHADVDLLIRKLGEMKIDSILVEGGSQLNYSVLRSGLVSEIDAYIAPKFVGGHQARGPVGGAGFDKIADCVELDEPEIEHFGRDLLLRFRTGRK